MKKAECINWYKENIEDNTKKAEGFWRFAKINGADKLPVEKMDKFIGRIIKG